MPEDLQLSQIGSSQLPPPFRGLHSPGVRKQRQIIFACYFWKSSIQESVVPSPWAITLCLLLLFYIYTVRERERASNFNIWVTPTLFMHAGLFCRVHDPPNSDKDHRIFRASMRSFRLHLHIGDLGIYIPPSKGFCRIRTDLDSGETLGAGAKPSM